MAGQELPGASVNRWISRVVAVALTLLVLVWAWARRASISEATLQRREAAVEARLRTGRLEMMRQQAAAEQPKLTLQLEVARHTETSRLTRLRVLMRELELKAQHAYEERQLRQPIAFGAEKEAGHGIWHGRDPDGSCPANLPQWDWQLLRTAAEANDGPAREEAISSLAAQSRLSEGEISDLARRYAGVLANPEFEGILDSEHPDCTGERFASLEGDRVLRIECDAPEGARYALDDEPTLHVYRGPVRVAEAETVLAFCGDEFNMLSHPRRKPEIVDRAIAAGGRAGGERKPSVLVFMVDATSRAHFRRSMPRTLAALDAIAKHGANAASALAKEHEQRQQELEPHDSQQQQRQQQHSAGDEKVEGRVHVFDFEHYNVVGYNSMPNQLPFFCGTSPDELSSLTGDRCVWEMFKRGGAVTMMAEEIHDACGSATTTINAVYKGAFAVQSSELPDHQWWKLFCSPHVKPCCWAKSGFLNPGRRQCVGGGRALHEVIIGYLEEFWSTYQDAPRRWAAVNTMVAHEHFMLRLPSLDADLAAMLLRMAATVLQDTVVLLLSDHGTHGIWYTDYEVGGTEHQLPFLYVLAPDWIMRQRPGWLEALTKNQKRLVTVHELYRAMQQLAAWPAAPSTGPGASTIFDELPPDRTCREAGVPEMYCACRDVPK
jgi:hypothetical protein